MVRQACMGLVFLWAAFAGQAQATNYNGGGSVSTWYRNHEGLRGPSISYCDGKDCVAENTTYAQASLNASMAPGSIQVDISANGWGDGWSEVSYRGFFNEQLTLTSASLAPGTPVQVRYSVLFDIATTGGADISPQFTVSHGRFADCCHAVFNQWDSRMAPPPALTQGVLQWHVGQTQDVTGQLLINVGQEFRAPGLATATGTVHYYVDVLDPQATLVSQSGHDYRMAAPVPEPHAWALMLAGVALLGRTLRSRKV